MPPVPMPNPELIVYLARTRSSSGSSSLVDDKTSSARTGSTSPTVATAAYLISRGLAKMRNVTEPLA